MPETPAWPQLFYDRVMTSLWKSTVVTLEMIKWEHSIFALPFALTGAVLVYIATIPVAIYVHHPRRALRAAGPTHL